MDILGIDIAKAKFDVHLCTGQHNKHAVFPNTEAGFTQLYGWLQRHRPGPAAPLHACMEATGNWGLDLAVFLHERAIAVSIVNPARIKAFSGGELARNKTDKLDAALIARFCRAHTPPAWTPPAQSLRDLRELVRRCEALKDARTQEINRQKAGFACTAVAESIKAHIAYLDSQIKAIGKAVDDLIASDITQQTNRTLLESIPGIGAVTSAVILAEVPNIAEFTPKALAAFAGLSPAEHSSGSSVRGGSHISRIGSARLRSVLYMAALSAKRYNPQLAGFVQRMQNAGKAKKVTLIAVARRLLVYAHAVIRTQAAFDPNRSAVSG
jgi:transposase